MSKGDKASTGIGALSILMFMLFLELKLKGEGQVACWSWFWITAPLWAPSAVGGIFWVVRLLRKNV